jgi:2-(1,2-epoxy-1,2-dihydrophenyl)acetyl-CoA isomerase
METLSSRFRDIELSNDEGIAVLLLNQPASLNACTSSMLAELNTALGDLAADESVRAVVLSGKGRLFCAGANLKEEAPEGATRQLLESYLPIFRHIASMEKPVIAAVNGGAVGVGLSLALSCDLVLMAEDAYLLSPFTRIGLVPDGGATWLLLRQLGYARAYEMAVSGEPVTAQRALELGLANRLVPPDDLLPAAVEWGREIVKSSAFALAQTKKLMRLAATSSYEDIFTAEARVQEECGKTEFFKQARRELFKSSEKD